MHYNQSLDGCTFHSDYFSALPCSQSYRRNLRQDCTITVIDAGLTNIPANDTNSGSRDVSSVFMTQCTHPRPHILAIFSKSFLLPGPYGLARIIKRLHHLRHGSTSIQGQDS
ncbi:uncharacterized protein ARMOST_09804 [Armillaria ostoyae]|uniref:Uncharacterized protein n=1 Tax=Armillaria ostoyae TaxID=47428 RepID=A0A284RCJ0_ARMOS|nr:uncharacterized protein ARMOST_09804 [Armillaria ostoyae]